MSETTHPAPRIGRAPLAHRASTFRHISRLEA